MASHLPDDGPATLVVAAIGLREAPKAVRLAIGPLAFVDLDPCLTTLKRSPNDLEHLYGLGQSIT